MKLNYESFIKRFFFFKAQQDEEANCSKAILIDRDLGSFTQILKKSQRKNTNNDDFVIIQSNFKATKFTINQKSVAVAESSNML